jgi:RNA polymerase sigma-70 factor (ECF subfamily)
MFLISPINPESQYHTTLSTRCAVRSRQSAPAKGSMDVPITDPDLELIRQAQSGDRNAFNMLVVKHQRRVAWAISGIVKSPQEVEELTQETFIKAWRGIMSFRGDSKFSTWLHRVAINTAKNHLVAQKSRISVSDIQRADDPDAVSPEGVDEEDPERLLAGRQIAETVARAMMELPEVERAALELRELEGKSYDEIAAALDCPVGTVRSRIFRARERVAAALRPQLEPYRGRRW